MHVVTTHDRVRPAPVVLLALTGVLAVIAAGDVWGATGSIIVVALAIGASAAIVDARSGRIPNLLVAAAALPTMALVIALAIRGSGVAALVAVSLGSLACAGPIFVIHLCSPAAMGFGDVKLAAALGAALGLVEPRLGLLALCLAAAVTVAVGVARRRSTLPFGPGLVLGAAMALLIAGQLGEEALRWQ